MHPTKGTNTVRAAVVLGADRPIKVSEVELNGPEQGEVLIKVHACGGCHSDLHVMRRMPPPAVFGHEVAGTVEALGRGGDDLAPGDHVLCAFHPSCGCCFSCVRGMPEIWERPDYPETKPSPIWGLARSPAASSTRMADFGVFGRLSPRLAPLATPLPMLGEGKDSWHRLVSPSPRIGTLRGSARSPSVGI